MFREPFPQISQWVNEHLSGERKEEFDEYRYAVEYHLSQAEEASQECSSSLWRFQWGISHDHKSMYILDLSPELLIRHGDIAIRAGASAIDTGLQLVNNVLDLGVRKTNIRWGRGSRESALRKALRTLPNNCGMNLVKVVDSIFGSIGYELLRDYRNWVTHRGAPRVIHPSDLTGPIPVPEDALEASEAAQREWCIRTHLLSTIPSQIFVWCRPFVPPVQTVVSATIDEAESDIVLPGGVFIGKGSRDITIRDMRVVAGSLTQDAEEFKSKNPILLEKHRAKFAGEDLAVYSAMDYSQAIRSVVRFVEQTLTGEWDAELLKSCQLRLQS